MTAPDLREERLPRWARQELAALRAELARALARLGEGPEGSNVHRAPRGMEETGGPIGHDVGVVFDLPGGQQVTVRHTPNRQRLVVTLSREAIGAFPVGSINVLTIGPAVPTDPDGEL